MARAPTLPGPIDPQLPQDYQRERLGPFDGGMDLAIQPETLPATKLTLVNNLFWYDGQILVDSGYAPFAPAVLLGTPQVAYQAFYPDGTTRLFLLTTETLYFLSSGHPPQWQFCHYGGGATMTSAAQTSGNTTLTITNESIFFNGASITYLLTNDTTANATVSSIAGSVLTISPAVPATGVNANAWVAVNLEQPTLTGDVAGGATTVPLSTTNGIVVGTNLGVECRDGTQWQFSVGAIDSLNITPADGVVCPAIGAASGASCAIAPAYSGRLSTQPVLATYPAGGHVIFSNGVDPIQHMDESGNVVQLAGLPDGTTCQAMNVAHEQLLIGNLVENGTAMPQRVRASDAGDHSGWVPGQNGIAAVYDLVDTEDWILSINLLGPWVIIYRETTIMRGSYLGLPLETWYWEYMVYGEGIQSQFSVSEIGESHFIVGTQGIYLYSGGYELNSIGDPIFAELLSAKGDLNAEAKSTIFTQYVSDQDEVWLFYPTTGHEVPDTMLRCSLEKAAWYVRRFANTFLSAGFFLPLATTEWIDAIGTWAQNTAAWNSRVFLQNAANIILCAADANQTMVYDYNTPGDNGVAVPWLMQTKDVGDGDVVVRWDTIVLYGSGNGVTVSYALDPANEPFPPQAPVVFRTLGVVNFGAGVSRQRLTLAATSTWIRLQFSGTDPTFSLNYCELWFSFESEW